VKQYFAKNKIKIRRSHVICFCYSSSWKQKNLPLTRPELMRLTSNCEKLCTEISIVLLGYSKPRCNNRCPDWLLESSNGADLLTFISALIVNSEGTGYCVLLNLIDIFGVV